MLVKFIMDEEALNKLEESRNVGVALAESQLYSKEGFKNRLKQMLSILSKLNLGTLTELTDEDKIIINDILRKMDNQKEMIRKLIM